ncbi:MAG: hypothetical protein ABSE57_29735 [Bryobacteraceae bacterium]|jgi:hypothetical protein
MPILLAFLACEKIIFEEDTKKATIVNVLHDVYVPVIRSVQIPPNTLAPLSWTAFSIWYISPSDGADWWEQKAVLVGENGEWLMESMPVRFQMTHPVMRAVTPFYNFPVYREAQCLLKLYTRNLGTLPDAVNMVQWNEIMVYPISLHHTFYPT